MSSRKVLFIKVGALGDVVMALPACRYLVEKGYQVTWVCGTSARPIVDHFSKAHEIITVHESNLFSSSIASKIKEVFALNAKFFGKTFEHVFIGNSDPRYQLLALTARGPRHIFKPGRDEHHTLAYLKMVSKALNEELNDPKPYIPLPLSPWQGHQSKKIAISPGGAKNYLADDDLRRWPIEHYVTLAKELIAKGYEVHVFGAPSDKWVLSAFEGLRVQNRIGEFDLISLIKEWSRFRCLITHDSGPLHFGGLADIPIIALFGPTLPSWRFPLQRLGRGLTVEPLLPCQPCYDGKSYAPCVHKNCLRAIGPERVLE